MKKELERIGLLSMKGNFDKKLGKGPQRYAYELYNNIYKLAKSKNIEIDKIEIGFGNTDIHHKISFTIMVPFKNLLKYDIIHLPAPIMFRPPLLKERRLITTVHELVVVPKRHILYRKDNQSLYDIFNPNLIINEKIKNQILSSDYIIAVSKQAKREIVGSGYPADRVVVINNGVGDEFISTAIPKKRKHKRFIVGYIGALNPRKNVSFAIEAFRYIKNKNIVFEIWGGKSGSTYKKLENQAVSDSRIKFMGFAPESKLIKIYDRFNVFVFPSVYESHSLTILEARARGLPIILNGKGTLSEENKKYCFNAASPKHMAKIIEDIYKNGYDKETRRRALRYAHKLTWEECALETIKFYKKVIFDNF